MRTVPGRPDELAAMSTLIVLSLPVVEWCAPPVGRGRADAGTHRDAVARPVPSTADSPT
jgi:hypothetical protein